MYTIALKTPINQFSLQSEAVYANLMQEVKKVTGREPLYIDRENFMFGYCPRFQFKDGLNCLVLYSGKLLTWDELKDELRKNWRPVAQDEIDYFCAEIG